MKLVNFASLDPAHRARGVSGLTGHSRADQEVWSAFHENWDQMIVEGDAMLNQLESPPYEAPYRPTESEALVMVRTVQGVFRRVVLAAYNSTCCITGNPVEELLVASHILPWSDFPQHRLNPKNGLCLAAHFDRAFDRHLITFDSDLRLVLSPALLRYLPNPALESEFVSREGKRLVCPDRFLPDPDFVAFHRDRTARAE